MKPISLKAGLMLDKFTDCTGQILVNTRVHHLHWDDHEMKTGIPCKKGNKAAAIIDIVGKSISKLVSLCMRFKS